MTGISEVVDWGPGYPIAKEVTDPELKEAILYYAAQLIAWYKDYMEDGEFMVTDVYGDKQKLIPIYYYIGDRSFMFEDYHDIYKLIHEVKPEVTGSMSMRTEYAWLEAYARQEIGR